MKASGNNNNIKFIVIVLIAMCLTLMLFIGFVLLTIANFMYVLLGGQSSSIFILPIF